MVALIYACLSEIRCYFGYTVLVAANLLQLCLALCDPIDCSPLGSPILGILQARTLEWVAISFPNAWKWKAKVKSLSRVRLFTTPWTADYQAPPPMGFSSQEYWSGLPLAGKLYSMGLHLGIIRIEKTTTTKNNERLLSSKMSILAVDLGTVEIYIVWIFVPMETNIRWPGTTLSWAVKCFHLRSTMSEFQDDYCKKEVYFLELADLS